ncbi:MAG TPA: hypothetical protein VG818_13580, partial [Gemmatimonadaceae bacterium]|nr:hypothetical protein [Gemmatimonadaceae bacterium]
MLTYRAPDGTEYRVEVTNPAASNAIVVFRHPDGLSARKDRYNWYISHGPEARSVTSRLNPGLVAQSLDQATLHRLFQRSMPVSRPDPLANP